MKEQEDKQTLLKAFLWMIIIGMVSYVGWSVIHIYREISAIQQSTSEYNRMLMDSIADKAEEQAEKVKSIKTVK